MNNQTIQLHKLTLSASTSGFEHIEYCIGTYQQLNDYAIGQASAYGCLWDSKPIDQGNCPTFNTKGIDQVKVLID